MKISAKVDEFMTAVRLSAIQLREAISIVPGGMGEETSMMTVINHAFHGIDMCDCSPETAIAAKRQDLERNELSFWSEEGGVLDENAGIRYGVAEQEFRARLEELDSPGYCLQDCLEFCELLLERINEELSDAQDELGNTESAKIGISDESTEIEANIGAFREQSWLQQHRRRSQIRGLLRQYRDLCRNALVMEAFYQIRLRCMNILGRIKSLVESERLSIVSLISEVSSFVTDLAESEREMQEFDYDSLVPNGKVMLDHGDLNFYFSEYRQISDGKPISDQDLAHSLLIQLYRKMGPMRDYIDRMESDIGPTLFQLSNEHFERMEFLGVEDVLEMKYANNKAGRDISHLLSQIRARLDESSRFLKISSLEKTGQDRKVAIRCISVKSGEDSRLAKEWLGNIVRKGPWNIVEGFCDTEITFYQAEYGYPMYALTTIKELLKAHKGSSQKKNENIFHLYRTYANLPELIPFNQDQALEVFHKAAAIGVLTMDDGSGWTYSQNGDIVSLGGNKEQILGFLNSNQRIVSKLNDQFRKQLLEEGITNIMPRMLSFAEDHKDGNGTIDPDLLQGIILRLDEEFAN